MWNVRLEYPALYNMNMQKIYTYTLDEYALLERIEGEILYNMIMRKRFHQYLERTGKTLKDMIRSGIYDQIIYPQDKINVIRDHAILVELPKKMKKRQNEFHKSRLDVARVVIKSPLPLDLLPTICAFAVPETKRYSYM